MKTRQIDEQTLDRYMKIAHDLHKVHLYDKTSGCWYWCDRSDSTDPNQTSDALVGPFNTFLDMLEDIVEPYVAGA